MQRQTWDIPHNGPKLYLEIVAAIPALAPDTHAVARFLLESAGTLLILTLPDNTDVAALGAVIAKHNPTPLPVPPSPAQTAVSALQVAATITDIKAALVAYLKAG